MEKTSNVPAGFMTSFQKLKPKKQMEKIVRYQKIMQDASNGRVEMRANDLCICGSGIKFKRCCGFKNSCRTYVKVRINGKDKLIAANKLHELKKFE